jgi:hypothetical protein
MDVTAFLSKAHNWKSLGNGQIQNYWHKIFPAAQRYITENFNIIMEELEKAPRNIRKENIQLYKPTNCVSYHSY